MPVKNKIRGPNQQRKLKGVVGRQIIEVGEERVEVYRMMDLLDLLLSRGQIDEEHHRVGLMLYRDWYYSGLTGVGAIDYSKIRVDVSGYTVSLRSFAAMRRFLSAVRALGSVNCHPILHMVLFEQSPEEYGKMKGYRNPKLARLVSITLLKNSLDVLIDHYSRKTKRSKQ